MTDYSIPPLAGGWDFLEEETKEEKNHAKSIPDAGCN